MILKPHTQWSVDRLLRVLRLLHRLEGLRIIWSLNRFKSPVVVNEFIYFVTVATAVCSTSGFIGSRSLDRE